MKFFTALIISAASLSQQIVFATQPNVVGSGWVATGANAGGNFSLGSNGSATSYAQNREAATAKVTTTADNTPKYTVVNAGVMGATTTESFGKAYNLSSGSGTGSATSAGMADTGVNGKTGIHGVSTGFNGGEAGTHTSNKVQAGVNQGSYVSGETKAGFDTKLHYEKSGGKHSGATRVSSYADGYAGGKNHTGSLTGLNAAGIASIGASGKFFAKAGLSTDIGPVKAP
ncbi:hypothetical protein [Noviherbaspirillum saxi]|nr:hypothetical protein [Noviherbaspirillum saxi]